MNINNFSELEILKVVKAYLLDGFSHRKIQWEILGIPAPTRGGGFVTMKILHEFGIYKEHKGILKNIEIDELIESSEGNLKNILISLKSYLIEEENADIIINSNKEEYFKVKNTELSYEVKIRVGQDKLRSRVLENYNYKCALCNINKEDLLICSHIVAWKLDEKNRLNPRNAICLCALHDKLFDKGYFSIDTNYKVIYTKKSDQLIKDLMENVKFRKPKREAPDPELLSRHMKLHI